MPNPITLTVVGRFDNGNLICTSPQIRRRTPLEPVLVLSPDSIAKAETDPKYRVVWTIPRNT